MLSIQRRQAMLDYLAEHTFADIDALRAHTGASPATVRRDLRILSEGGYITRARGGATVATHSIGHERPYSARAREHLSEKRSIAQLAGTLILESEVLALDVGSSTLELAKTFLGRQRLTVFTASLPIAQVLTQSDVSVVMVGGVLRKKELSLAGRLAIETINQFHFDKFFLGTSAVSVDDGFTDFSIEDIELKKAIIARSKEVIALADGSKLGQVSFAKICDLEAVGCLITDAQADPAEIERLREAGLNVLIAGKSSAERAPAPESRA